MKKVIVLCGVMLMMFAASVNAETGQLVMDGTETISLKGGSLDTNTSGVVSGDIFYGTVGHGNFETTRFYVPLAGTYDGATDVFRMRTRTRRAE